MISVKSRESTPRAPEQESGIDPESAAESTPRAPPESAADPESAPCHHASDATVPYVETITGSKSVSLRRAAKELE